MQRLELLLLTLLGSCIHSPKFQDNLNYLRTLQVEQVFEDSSGIYYKVIDHNGRCTIDFELKMSPEEDPDFDPMSQENIILTNRLYQEYCK